MPSKYYNPRLNRSVGLAEGNADLFGGTSEVIEKSFKKGFDALDKMQERRAQANEIKRKKLESIEKDAFAIYEEYNQENMGIPEAHRPGYKEAIFNEKRLVGKCLSNNANDPLARSECAQSFRDKMGVYKSVYGVMGAKFTETAKRISDHGVSKITRTEHLDMFNALKDTKNWKASINKDGVLVADFSDNPELLKLFGRTKEDPGVDVNATLANISIVDKAGAKVHQEISGKIAESIYNDTKNNFTVKQSQVKLENTLGKINPTNVGEIALQLGMGGANGEYSEGLARIIDPNSIDEMVDFDDDFIANTEPEEIQRLMLPENENELQNLAEKNGWAILKGPEAMIERVRDTYRFQYFDSRNRIQKEKQDKENKILNSKGSGSTSTGTLSENEVERKTNIVSILPTEDQFRRTGSYQGHKAYHENEDTWSLHDDVTGQRYKKWENLMVDALQLQGISVKKSKSDGKNILQVNVGTKSRQDWQELSFAPAEVNAQKLMKWFPDLNPDNISDTSANEQVNIDTQDNTDNNIPDNSNNIDDSNPTLNKENGRGEEDISQKFANGVGSEELLNSTYYPITYRSMSKSDQIAWYENFLEEMDAAFKANPAAKKKYDQQEESYWFEKYLMKKLKKVH